MQKLFIGGCGVALSLLMIKVDAMEDLQNDGITMIVKPLTPEQQQKQKKPDYMERVPSEVDLNHLVQTGECRVVTGDDGEKAPTSKGLGKAFEMLRQKREQGFCTMHNSPQARHKDKKKQLEQEFERCSSAPSCLKFHVEPKSSPQPKKLSKKRTELQLSKGSKELLNFDKEAAEQMIADLMCQRDELAKLVGDAALIEFERLKDKQKKTEELRVQERAQHYEVNAQLYNCIVRLERQLRHEKRNRRAKRKKKVSSK